MNGFTLLLKSAKIAWECRIKSNALEISSAQTYKGFFILSYLSKIDTKTASAFPTLRPHENQTHDTP